MATMWTPLIDLEEDDRQATRATGRDDREIGFAMPEEPEPQHLETHPRANGDLDGEAVSRGEEAWDSVLGW